MEIDWMILAESIKAYGNDTFDILGITNSDAFDHPPYDVSYLNVIVKSLAELTEVGQEKEIIFQVRHLKSDTVIYAESKMYQISDDISYWAKATTYLVFGFPSGLTLPYTGGYDFEILVDDVLATKSWFQIVDRSE